jgi:outer membrane protein assembly factor BamD
MGVWGKKSFLAMLVCGVIVSCGGKKDLTQYMTSKEHFEYAMKYFTKKNYLKAQDEFSLITYKYSGSDVADDAQYYLAECYYREGDYVTASSEFDRLTTTFPKSEFVEDSMYKLAICYFKLSPDYALDQKFTMEAVNAVQNFMDLYPRSAKKEEINKIFKDLKWKLARKQFESANVYRKISEYEAAIVYYDQIITDYYDSPFVPKAKFWKGYCNFKIKEFQKATLILKKFIDDYPMEKDLVKEAQEILTEIKKKQAEIKTVVSDKN